MVRDEYGYPDRDLRDAPASSASYGEEIQRGQRLAERQTHGQNSDEIRREIDATRCELDRTVDLLQAKLSPDQLMSQAMDRFFGWAKSKKSKAHTESSSAGVGACALPQSQSQSKSKVSAVTDVIRDHPVPAALVGLGVGLYVANRMRGRHSHEAPHSTMHVQERAAVVAAPLPRTPPPPTGAYSASTASRMSRGGMGEQESRGSKIRDRAEHLKDEASERWDESKSRATGAMHQAKERFSSAMDTARSRMSHASESMREWGSHQSEAMGEQWSQARSSVGDMSHALRDRAVQTTERTRHAYDEHPLAFGIAAVGVGVLAGLLIPSTRREDELMGDARDATFRSAKEMGRDLMHRGQEVARAAGQTLQEETGLDDAPSGHEMIDRAKHAVEAAGDAATRAAEEQMMSPEEMENKEKAARKNVSEAAGGQRSGSTSPSSTSKL